MLKADQFPFRNTYQSKSEYKQLESKVDKSILNKERHYISGYDAIYFHDKTHNNLDL